MKSINKLGKIVSRFNILPRKLRATIISKIFGGAVKFAGTAGIRFDKLTFKEAELSIENRKKVQNHIKSVHAAATALLGETASGFLVGLHVPDDRLPLLKSMHIDYVKRSTGKLTATCELTDEEINMIRNTEKGEITITVKVTDENNIEPVIAKYDWAWIPKPKK